MKTFKFMALAAAACLSFCLVSCKKDVDEKVSGTYGVTVNVDVDYNKGSGIIFSEMENAVNTVAKDFSFRTKANDDAIIAATDKVEKDYKDQADKEVVISVVFKPGNVVGQPEKNPEVVKAYTFKPVL